MRGKLIVAAAAIFAATASGARAEGWCGYAAREKAMIECGYSSAAECESTVGKGGMCFVDPDYAMNVRHAGHSGAAPTGARANAVDGRS